MSGGFYKQTNKQTNKQTKTPTDKLNILLISDNDRVIEQAKSNVGEEANLRVYRSVSEYENRPQVDRRVGVECAFISFLSADGKQSVTGNLPDADGLRFIEKLHSRHPDLPIIGLEEYDRHWPTEGQRKAMKCYFRAFTASDPLDSVSGLDFLHMATLQYHEAARKKGAYAGWGLSNV